MRGRDDNGEPGHYWIRLHVRRHRWYAAELKVSDGTRWWEVTGQGTMVFSKEIAEVGHRIEPPP